MEEGDFKHFEDPADEELLDIYLRESVLALGDSLLDDPLFGESTRHGALFCFYLLREEAPEDDAAAAAGVAEVREWLPPLTPAGARRLIGELEAAGQVRRLAETTEAWVYVQGWSPLRVPPDDGES